MATIIKSGGGSSAFPDVQPVAFSLADVTSNAQLYLEQVHRQASQIISQARADADQIRKQAEHDGMKSAVVVAEKSLRATLDPKLGSVLKSLQEAVTQIVQARQAWLAQWEKNAVHLAAAIARRIVRRELAADPHITLALVREALELAAGSQRIKIALNPHDYQILGTDAAAVASTLSTAAPATVVSDAQVAAGGCVVTTEFGSIDNTLDVQLARLEQELT